MAISRRKGKLIFVLTVSLLVSDLFYFPRFPCLVLASESDPSSNFDSLIETSTETHNPFRERLDLDNENSDYDVVLIRKQQFQLEKLQELVQNLTQLVTRLESRFSDAPDKVKTSSSSSPQASSGDGVTNIKDEDRFSGNEEVREGVGSRAETVSLRKYNSLWSERFQFVSAVKLRSNPTCISVLPHKDFEGLSKYFAVGDDKGMLYVFMRSGDVALEFETFSDSEEPFSITSIVSYLSVYKNESFIVTGHENGVIVMHRVWETVGDEWSSLHFEKVRRFEMPESGGSRISMLDVHHVGRRRYVLATDGGGKIIVFREDGTIYGTATPSRQPIAFLKQRLLFLTENGAGSLDLRTMKLKETECEGLNGSSAISYVFDAMDRSKAYGLTLEGDMVQTLLLGDVMNFKCRVRSKKKLDLFEPVALQAIKGYLLVSNRKKVFVYNVSSQHYVRAGGVRFLFSTGLDEIIASFLNQQAADVANEHRMQTPLITTDYEKLVILSLGNGYVAMYRSNLPVFKNEFNSILWTSPVLFFILFLFGAWHFFANKKEALTSWGPDDPFSSGSVTSGAPLGSGSGERSFTESSRSPEMVELRGSGLRGSSRYVSPPRYPGGTTNPYRPGPDTDSRTASVDPRFRANSELKFRGPTIEAAGVPKRRDTLFVNSSVVDDNTS